MKGHNRKFFSGSLNHCYQNTKNSFLLFYTPLDCLVFFTIFCITAKRYNVKILKLCLMPDHVHFVVMAESRKVLYSFVRDYTKLFAKTQNEFYGTKGALFNSPFGSAPKKDLKQIKTNLIYVDNNPVERCIVAKAEDYQWNFVAYAKSKNPFSEPLVPGKESKRLIDAMAMVQERNDSGHPLSYPLILLLYKGLNQTERNQLIDHVISVYSAIDHETAIRFFGSYDNMLMADHSTTGSEYEIKESFIGKRDDVYSQLTQILLHEFKFRNVQTVLKQPVDEKFKMFQLLFGKTDATPEQLAKYLRIPLMHVQRSGIAR